MAMKTSTKAKALQLGFPPTTHKDAPQKDALALISLPAYNKKRRKFHIIFFATGNVDYLYSHIVPFLMICGHAMLLVENGCNVPLLVD